MLGTSTHDTKRGEDTRARLAVLSEMPDEWERQVKTWSRMLRARRGDVAGTAPPDTQRRIPVLSAPARGLARRTDRNVTQPDAIAAEGLCRARRRRDDQVHARGEGPFDLGRPEHGL